MLGLACARLVREYLESVSVDDYGFVCFELRNAKTYQDTIRTCLNLGVDFIWIDSLCIAQDDELHWGAQAARTADIYEHSTFTIAAKKAGDVSERLSSKVDKRFRGVSLPEYTNVYDGRVIRDPTDVEFTPAPLLDRGWMYQELLLSTRAIHFDAREVMLTCHTVMYHQTRAP